MRLTKDLQQIRFELVKASLKLNLNYVEVGNIFGVSKQYIAKMAKKRVKNKLKIKN